MMERFTYIDRQAASGEEYGDIAAVIKAAEQRMYVDKKRYYMEHGDRVICASVNIRKAAFPWQLF